MTYTIWCEPDLTHKVLGRDNRWYIATNQAKTFLSVNSAKHYYFSDKCDSEAVGSCVWIKGPRGGIYPMRRVA